MGKIEKPLKLNGEILKQYLRFRNATPMIDMMELVIRGKSAKGYKNLSGNEWHFQGHPTALAGVLQFEILVQCLLAIVASGKETALRSALVQKSEMKLRKSFSQGDCFAFEMDVSPLGGGQYLWGIRQGICGR